MCSRKKARSCEVAWDLMLKLFGICMHGFESCDVCDGLALWVGLLVGLWDMGGEVREEDEV